MNNLLFRVAELEEKFQKQLYSEKELDRILGECQLKTLDVFKHYPIRSQEESNHILNELNQIFRMS